MLYFYYGQEDFLIELELKKLKNKLVDKAFVSTNYRVYENPSYIELMDILCTPSLMFGSILAVINCEKYFFDARGKVGFDDKELKRIEEILQNIPDSLNIVFVCKIERGSTKKIDTRKKIFKILSKYASVSEFSEFKSYQKELVSWVQNLVKQKNLIMAPDVIKFLIERLGTNLRLINTETDKLKLSVYPSKTVKKEDIQNICTSSEDIFVLSDYILKGEKDKALLEFKKLCTDKHYLEILAVLQTNFSKLAAMKVDALTLSPYEISAKTRLPEFIVKKQLEKIRSVPMDRLIKIRKNLLEAEYRVKTGEISFYELPVELALLN